MSGFSVNGRLERDSHGVPQFAGEVEYLEEYLERAWDLFHGREGQESLQIATPLHLRAQLQGTAYEAVRKLSHSELRTKTAEGKATEEGMNLLLNTLKGSLATEAPVRVQELFLEYFYSKEVWRRNNETMAQYIVRRELSFARLKEANSETNLSDNLKCMLLLLFSGLDLREQQGILSSVNNEYDYKKVSHALRIQFPNVTSTRPVVRKDFLGTGRGSNQLSMHNRARWKGFPKKQIFAAEFEDEDIPEDDEVFAEEESPEYEQVDDETYVAYSEDETLETLMNEVPPEALEDEAVAEAFATIAQHRGSFKKKFIKRPSPGSSATQTFPFKAQGEMSLDQKAKDQRKAAVSFLKTVTQCTACNQKGHWVGDPECPRASKKGGGSKGHGKSSGKASPKKKPGSPVKKSTNFFVLHDKIESDDEQLVHYAHKVPFDLSPDSNAVPANDKTFAYDLAPAYEPTPKNVHTFEYTHVSENDQVHGYDKVPDETYGNPSDVQNRFTDSLPVETKCFDVMMALRAPQLCEHASYHGGSERQFHRGANGHTRHITCKECNKSVIVARRKEPVQLWAYLTQIAMCTKWGSAAKSRELAARVAQLTVAGLPGDEVPADPKYGPRPNPPSVPYPVQDQQRHHEAGWQVLSSPSSPGSTSTTAKQPSIAKIVRGQQRGQQASVWLYGVKVDPFEELPPFPELPQEELGILQPLPGDQTLFSDGPFALLADPFVRWHHTPRLTSPPTTSK